MEPVGTWLGGRSVEVVMRRIAALFLTLLLLGACGEPPASPGGSLRGSPQPSKSTQKYRTTGLVLQEENAEPMLCLGAVAESLPPQCGGPRIEGWNWDVVSGEESAAGVTWGSFEVTGLYDGDTFTLLEAGPPSESSGDDDPIKTACPEPAGGWESPNPALSSESDQINAIQAARQEPDFAGAWIDNLGEVSEFGDQSHVVLNVAFTGDLGVHEQQIRESWGGPLCLTQREHTLDRILEIQSELSGEVGRELGIEIIASDASETRSVVEISVVVIDAATQQKIDERYGEGTVEVTARLRPVP
jgi:hypothetical protein